jgi:hypothetical protein
MVKPRYDVLRFLCTVGRIASVVGIVIGLLTLFTLGSTGTAAQSIVIVVSAAMSYITFEAVLVLVAIEANTRATSTLLRRQQRRRLPPPEEDDWEEGEEEMPH